MIDEPGSAFSGAFFILAILCGGLTMKKSKHKAENQRMEKSNLEKELKICMAKRKVLLDNISKGRQDNFGLNIMSANI
jgi:hypothetical protein